MNKYDIAWQEKYKLAKDYFEQNGDLLIPYIYEIDGIKLGTWIGTQRKAYIEGTLSKERINKLNELNIVWNIHTAQWDEKYKLAEQYFNEHGNLSISVIHRINGIELGSWVGKQRKDYKEGILSKERIDKLNNIGIVWDVLAVKWEETYRLAYKYYEEHGDLYITMTYEIDGVKLGIWIGIQRKSYWDGSISQERINKLEAIGMAWDFKTVKWMENYKLAKEYYNKYGDLAISQNCEVDGVKLGYWLNRQRKAYKKGTLSQEYINKLESIGIVWKVLTTQWEEAYELVKQYYENYGNLSIPQTCYVNGVNLNQWINTQRRYYKKGKISKERIDLLNKIGLTWDAYFEQWEENYILAKEYYNKYGDLSISIFYEADGNAVGRWISTQRIAYKRKELSQERIDKLESIGMIWDNSNTRFHTSFPEQAIFFYIKSLFPNAKNRYTDLGFELDIYIPELQLAIEYDGQRFHKSKANKDIEKNNKCVKNRITLIRVREPKCPELKSSSIDFRLKDKSINELEKSISSIIETINNRYNLNIDIIANIQKKSEEIYQQYIFHSTKQWKNNYKLAKKYFTEHGDLYITRSYESQGVKLGNWIHTQRNNYKRGLLTKEQIDQLDSIGMLWDPFIAKWKSNYKLAKDYFEQNGDLLIPYTYEIDGIKLGVWISTQRKAYTSETLSQDYIDQLECIGMVWNTIVVKWEESYRLAKHYYIKYGDLIISRTYEIDGVKLGIWLHTQRKTYREKTISQERINKLETIGMIWDLYIAKWEEKYKLAKKYYSEYNNLSISITYEIDGVNLGSWICTQRTAYKKRELSQERIDKLESIGMIWSLK